MTYYIMQNQNILSSNHNSIRFTGENEPAANKYKHKLETIQNITYTKNA